MRPDCRAHGRRAALRYGDEERHRPLRSLEIAEAGSLEPEQFDAAVYDLVNFLAYSAEPIKADRQRIGIYVLLFIAVFFVFASLLNREYWKDVH